MTGTTETTTEAPIDYGQFWRGRVVSYRYEGMQLLGHIESFYTLSTGSVYITVNWGNGSGTSTLPKHMHLKELTLL